MPILLFPNSIKFFSKILKQKKLARFLNIFIRHLKSQGAINMKKLTLLALAFTVLAAANCAKPMDSDFFQPAETEITRASFNSGSYRFELNSNLLTAYLNGAKIWQISVNAGYIAGLNTAKDKLTVIGANNIYVVKMNGQMDAQFDAGYNQISALKTALGIRGGAVGNALASYCSGKALLYGMWGMIPLSAWYQSWGWFFQALPF